MKQGLSQSDVLNILRREKRVLHEEFGVEKIAIFGSFAKGNPTSKSDIDILVGLSKPLGFGYMRLANHLEDCLGRKVDLVTFEAIMNANLSPRHARITDEIERTMMYA